LKTGFKPYPIFTGLFFRILGLGEQNAWKFGLAWASHSLYQCICWQKSLSETGSQVHADGQTCPHSLESNRMIHRDWLFRHIFEALRSYVAEDGVCVLAQSQVSCG
jgi:hypothetical protein